MVPAARGAYADLVQGDADFAELVRSFEEGKAGGSVDEATDGGSALSMSACRGWVAS